MAVSIALHACLLFVPNCEQRPATLRVARLVQTPEDAATSVDNRVPAASGDMEALERKGQSVPPIGTNASSRGPELAEEGAPSAIDRGSTEAWGNAPPQGPVTSDSPEMSGANALDSDPERLDADRPSGPEPALVEQDSTLDADLEALDDQADLEEAEPLEEDAEAGPLDPDTWSEVVLLEAPGETPEVAQAEAAFDFAGARRAREASADEDLGPRVVEVAASRAEARQRERDGRAAPARAAAEAERGAEGDASTTQTAAPARDAQPAVPGRTERSSDGSQGRRSRGQSNPTWWSPMAVRVPPSPRDTEALAEPQSGDVPTQRAEQGMRQTPSLTPLARRRVATVVQQTAEEERGDPDREGEDLDVQDPLDAQHGTVAEADLLDAEVESETDELPAKPSELTPHAQRAQEGSQGTTALQGGTALASFEGQEGALAVDARRTERGVWITEVDRIVRASWQSQPLPMALRGQQVKGDVAVRFVILDGGRVEAVEIVRSSGNAWLDAMATSAIPKRVPRPPKSLGLDSVVHEITFRYR